MANLTVRRNANPAPAPVPATRELDPLRMMRDWMRFDPFQEITPLFSTEATTSITLAAVPGPYTRAPRR